MIWVYPDHLPLEPPQVGIDLPLDLVNVLSHAWTIGSLHHPLVPLPLDHVQDRLQLLLQLVTLHPDGSRSSSVDYPCGLAGTTTYTGELPEPLPLPLGYLHLQRPPCSIDTFPDDPCQALSSSDAENFGEIPKGGKFPES